MAVNRENLYRRVALERMTSPEQLDQLMQIASARLWLGLLAAALLMTAVAVWAVFGSIPSRVHATGVLIRTGGVYNVTSPSTGLVGDVAVEAGDVVHEGQVVARVGQPALIDRLKRARARLQEHEDRHRSLVWYLAQTDSLSEMLERREQEILARSIESLAEERRWLEVKVQGQRALLHDGLIRREELLQTEQRLAAARIRNDQLRGEMQELALRYLSDQNGRIREGIQSTQTVEEVRREVAQLEAEIQEATQVRSPHSGRILEVMVEVGSLSQQGRPLMRLDRIGSDVQNLEAVIYLPGTSGKRVRQGMRVQLSPANVKREESGYMIGTVEAVSEFPATHEAMHRTLKNENLVQMLSGGGPAYEAFVTLRLDPRSPDGYAWSASAPGFEIHSGTLCSATITTRQRRPIELVSPFLRRTVGL